MHGQRRSVGATNRAVDDRPVLADAVFARQSTYNNVPDSSEVVDNGQFKEENGGGKEREGGAGFEWLREFGNGKTDIAGLVLSTVLLMTAVAPLG